MFSCTTKSINLVPTLCNDRWNFSNILIGFRNITSKALTSGFVAAICIAGIEMFLYKVGTDFLDLDIVENEGVALGIS